MTPARDERHALADALMAAGPHAPTLCEGWTAHDLLAHVWIRESRSWLALGAVAKPFAGVTDAAMARAKAERPFADLVAEFRSGPPTLSPFALPGADEAANLVEYFVHTEDVRRAAGLGPRTLSPGLAEGLWRTLARMGRLLLRRAPVGVRFERADGAAEPMVAKAGERMVTVIGDPGELILFAYGRQKHAQVRYVGEPDAVAALTDEHTGW